MIFLPFFKEKREEKKSSFRHKMIITNYKMLTLVLTRDLKCATQEGESSIKKDTEGEGSIKKDT